MMRSAMLAGIATLSLIGTVATAYLFPRAPFEVLFGVFDLFFIPPVLAMMWK